MIALNCFTHKFILIIICLINLNTHFVNGQAFSVAVANSYGPRAAVSSSSSTGFGFTPLVNKVYQTYGGGFSDLSIYHQAHLPPNAHNFYNIHENNPAYINPSMVHVSSQALHNNNRRPPVNNFYQTQTPRRVTIKYPNNFNRTPQTVLNGRRHNHHQGNLIRQPAANPVLGPVHKPNRESLISQPAVNPILGPGSPLQNHNKGSLINEPAANPLSAPVPVFHDHNKGSLISEPAANPLLESVPVFHDYNKGSLISEPAVNPLLVPVPAFQDHNKGSLISEPAANPILGPVHNPSRESLISQPAVNAILGPESPLQNHNKGSLISEPAANPLSEPIPVFHDHNKGSLISEPAANPLSESVPVFHGYNKGSLISEPAANPLSAKLTDPLFISVPEMPNNNKSPPTTISPLVFITPTKHTHAVHREQLQPGIIINPDSPYYIPKESVQPSLLFDVRRY